MEEVVFDTINTAAYSPRPNTPAATWTDQIPDEIKRDRLQRINVLVKEHAKERRSRLLDKTVEVLVEERNIKVPTQVTGRTRHNYSTFCLLFFGSVTSTTRLKRFVFFLLAHLLLFFSSLKYQSFISTGILINSKEN